MPVPSLPFVSPFSPSFLRHLRNFNDHILGKRQIGGHLHGLAYDGSIVIALLAVFFLNRGKDSLNPQVVF